jgi:hypothetical protein
MASNGNFTKCGALDYWKLNTAMRETGTMKLLGDHLKSGHL